MGNVENSWFSKGQADSFYCLGSFTNHPEYHGLSNISDVLYHEAALGLWEGLML